MFGDSMGRFIIILSVYLGVIYGTRIMEKRRPIAPTPNVEVHDDWLAVIISIGLPVLLAPLSTTITAALWGWTGGGGMIRLPTSGYGYFASVALVVVIIDLYKYSFHRLQHAIPFLWAMHSFHHSANALTFITGGRHYWMEKAFIGAALPLLAILFDIPADMASVSAVIAFLPDSCAHLNVRFPMGRMITWVNNPQWHRIHHSNLPEHRDKNFASVLPLWDFVFGTAHIPKPDEYPVTGFDPPVRVDVIDSIIWPIRHLLRRLRQTERVV